MKLLLKLHFSHIMDNFFPKNLEENGVVKLMLFFTKIAMQRL